MTENGVTREYTYNGAGQLVTETLPENRSIAYAYDKYGNRREQTEYDGSAIAVQTAYTYDKNNRLLQSVQTQGETERTTAFTYDANGNQICKMISQQGPDSGEREWEHLGAAGYAELYTYDVWNRMTASSVSGRTARYTYDGNNLRQTKTADGVTTTHIWNGANIIADQTAEGTQVYTRGVGLINMKTGDTTQYYHKNLHGDVAALTNGNGAKTEDYTYDAFGNQLRVNIKDTNPTPSATQGSIGMPKRGMCTSGQGIMTRAWGGL